MGTYTEFYWRCTLDKSIKDNGGLKILKYMLGKKITCDEGKIPNHPLFEDTQWEHMLRMRPPYGKNNSYITGIGGYFLSIHSEFKNYNDEINKFIDWITPYIDRYNDEFLGYAHSEYGDIEFFFYKESKIHRLFYDTKTCLVGT